MSFFIISILIAVLIACNCTIYITSIGTVLLLLYITIICNDHSQVKCILPAPVCSSGRHVFPHVNKQCNCVYLFICIPCSIVNGP